MEDLREGLPVEVIEIENAKLAFHVADMVHDGMCLCLMDREFIVLQPELIRGLDKCLDSEGIMLGGNREPGLAGGSVDEPFFQDSILRDDLPCVAQEFFPILCDGDSTVGSQKECKAKLFLQLPDRAGQGGLCDIEPVGCFVHAAAVGDGDSVSHLLKGHGIPPKLICA